jgi:hypothetical protein
MSSSNTQHVGKVREWISDQLGYKVLSVILWLIHKLTKGNTMTLQYLMYTSTMYLYRVSKDQNGFSRLAAAELFDEPIGYKTIIAVIPAASIPSIENIIAIFEDMRYTEDTAIDPDDREHSDSNDTEDYN